MASHYGRHYLAQQYGILDDGDRPFLTFHEEIYKALGATTVFMKREGCAVVMLSYGLPIRRYVSQPYSSRKFNSAKEDGVQLMTTTCPGCNVGT